MTSSISTMGQSLSQITRITTQQATLADLQLQLTSGKKSQTFSGLGTEAIVSKRSRAEFNAIEVYSNNIANADRRLQLMSTAIEELQAQAGNMADIVAGELQQGEIDLQKVNDLSTNILNFMEDLINAQDGERYLFGGAASGSQPLSLAKGTLPTFMQGELTDWRAETLSTDNLISSYRNVSDTITGYNAELSAGTVGSVSVRADTRTEIDYTTLGNDSGFKDIIVATQMLSELTVTDTDQFYHIEKIKLELDDFEGATLPTDLPQTPPPATAVTLPLDENFREDSALLEQIQAENQLRADNFFEVFNDLGIMINDALDQLDQLRFSIESDRARLSNIGERHELDQNTLLGTISDVEDADISKVALSLNFQQVQLEASYRVTASLSSLNLANFL